MEPPSTRQCWRVTARYYTSRYIARTNTGDFVTARDVVPEPVPLASVVVEDFDIEGAASEMEYRDWQLVRQRGTASGVTNDEALEGEEAYGEFGEWGVLWVARGQMTVVVAAADPDALEVDDIQDGLPTGLDPDEFAGEAVVADWV